MDVGMLERETGSVVLQVGGLELLARYSMNSGRATSLLSSLHEFRTQEAEIAGNKQWNWKYLRDQFEQKSLESLYRKYDDRLRSSFMAIYLGLLTCFTCVHILMIVLNTYTEMLQWNSTYLSLGLYTIRIIVPCCLLYKKIYEPLKEKYFWIPVLVTFSVIIILIVTDVTVALYSNFEGVRLRPAYGSTVLLSCYIFLPMRNNYLAIFLGVCVSIIYIVVTSVTSYDNYPYSYFIVASDVIYLLGVNILGIYFRLMNEIVTRRSFLDRRACVESTLKLNFEKNQEERLMLSILPEHIASRVRQDIRTTFLGIQTHTLSYNKKTLNQLYIEEHENVSILYADVVNYTKISTTLSPLRMVELLNELFGRFDEASEDHDVLRIKFLGDCYYCVSGIPDPNPQHAKSCVDVGLEMISIIKDVREKRSLNIDMRIGVHTGKILSGLIGIRKWQYDIWSKDVTIANKMESTGKPGKVHITKQTLESLEEAVREYIIEPYFDAQNDPFIRKHKLETYLLSKPCRVPIEYTSFRRASVGLNRMIKKVSNKSRSDSKPSLGRRRTTAFMDNNLVAYQQMLKAADDQMEKEIDDMDSGRETIFKETPFNKWILSMGLFNTDLETEKTYLLLPDPLFKYYILTCLIIVILIFLINGLTTNWYQGFKWYAWLLYGNLAGTLIILQPLTWFQFLWMKHNGVQEPRHKFLRFLYDASAMIVRSAKIRTALYVFISFSLSAGTIISVVDCTEVAVDGVADTVLSNCVSPWHVTQTWGLALLLNFLFSRVFFIFKWIMALLMTTFYLWVVWERKSALFAQDSTWNVGLDPRVSHTLAVVFITVTLYWVDRTTEYRNRLDHMWQVQLTEKQEEASTMLKVNSMLLQNILPAHVADLYLDVNRPTDELYYEKYDNVAVMFASLTDYKLGVDDDADMGEKMILGILDQVISDFDRLLITGMSSIYRVEKIKMAGWTYMAACGLDPNRRDSLGSEDSYDPTSDKIVNSYTQYDKNIVLTMVQFAAAMLLQLRAFNKGSFQSFEGLNLQVGISNGEVAAGVVGALKPLYDIWGHAVNMASRMASTGEAGRIHVTENTAIVLDDCGILTKFRGRTFVKGAGYVRTYFVPLDSDFKPIKKVDSADYFDNNIDTVQHNIRNLVFGRDSGASSSTSEVLSETTEAVAAKEEPRSYQIRIMSDAERTSSDDSDADSTICRDGVLETRC